MSYTSIDIQRKLKQSTKSISSTERFVPFLNLANILARRSLKVDVNMFHVESAVAEYQVDSFIRLIGIINIIIALGFSIPLKQSIC